MVVAHIPKNVLAYILTPVLTSHMHSDLYPSLFCDLTGVLLTDLAAYFFPADLGLCINGGTPGPSASL